MKSSLILATVVAATLSTLANATPQERAREAAARGPNELRQFVHLTRAIYQLDINDFATVGDNERAPMESGTQPADTTLVAKKREKAFADFREQFFTNTPRD
jgi:hypothetical protein